MVNFLVGLVSMILMRTLRKDYARYSKDEDIDDMASVAARFEELENIKICCRKEIWEMNMVGSKCMATFSVRRRILYGFALLSGLVIS